jgi:CRISPR-associated protein Cas1
VYLTENQVEKQYWNIPIANTTVLLLGIGTSITQAAVRLLASASVMIGFSGNGGTPLIVCTEVEWLSPKNEYRPTKYMQGWMSFWFNEEKRLAVAKSLQNARIEFLHKVWRKDRDFQSSGFYTDDLKTINIFKDAKKKIDKAVNTQELLLTEALLTKELYKIAAKNTKCVEFKRENCEPKDKNNKFLNHGNYLAYGLAASALWVLGISHSFAVMHGKTRRGALVFDVADLIKDALILPQSFISSNEDSTEQEFRQQCLNLFIKHNALDFMFNTIKDIALQNKKI